VRFSVNETLQKYLEAVYNFCFGALVISTRIFFLVYRVYGKSFRFYHHVFLLCFVLIVNAIIALFKNKVEIRKKTFEIKVEKIVKQKTI
jgi:hypothetical protein